MKIAIASADEQTISRHFGRAEKYVVFSVENGQVIDRKIFPKLGHEDFSSQGAGQHRHKQGPRGSGFGFQAKFKHEQMTENIKDCDMLLARGMGRGAYLDLQNKGIKPIITDIANIETAVQAVMDGTIIDHKENLH